MSCPSHPAYSGNILKDTNQVTLVSRMQLEKIRVISLSAGREGLAFVETESV
jgi:hypothetical protein